MTTIAVTGHMDLTEDSVPLVRNALHETLKPYADDLMGVSCIAKGSDGLFAEVVLQLGGRLVVVIPSKDYRRTKVEPEHAEMFDRLTAAAVEVVVLNHETANRSAYEDANRTLIQRPNVSSRCGTGSLRPAREAAPRTLFSKPVTPDCRLTSCGLKVSHGKPGQLVHRTLRPPPSGPEGGFPLSSRPVSRGAHVTPLGNGVPLHEVSRWRGTGPSGPRWTAASLATGGSGRCPQVPGAFVCVRRSCQRTPTAARALL